MFGVGFRVEGRHLMPLASETSYLKVSAKSLKYAASVVLK